jgi:hypothetical protein
MFAEIAIIPLNKSFEHVANQIQDRLKCCSISNISSTIDNNYSLSMNKRFDNWIDMNYEIIIINQEYNKTKKFEVCFYDSIKSNHTMDIEELIELIESVFSDDEDEDDGKDNKKATNVRTGELFDDNNDNGSETESTCVIS